MATLASTRRGERGAEEVVARVEACFFFFFLKEESERGGGCRERKERKESERAAAAVVAALFFSVRTRPLFVLLSPRCRAGCNARLQSAVASGVEERAELLAGRERERKMEREESSAKTATGTVHDDLSLTPLRLESATLSLFFCTRGKKTFV